MGPLQQSTGGSITWRLDLAEFEPIATLDTYAFATVCWEEPPAPPQRPTTSCVQLALRGTLMPVCSDKPCAGHMAVEVRASSNLAFDGADTDPNKPGTQVRPEANMCGEGTRPPKWLPLGPGNLVTLAWGPHAGEGVHVSTEVDAVKLAQGMRRPGFGWWVEGIHCVGTKCGIGWSYKEDWTLKAHGGRAAIIEAKTVGPLPIMSRCP